MTDTDVTAVVLTLNEEPHLNECLASLEGLVRRTIVLDSGSTDHTQDIARARGADVVYCPFRGYASQRNEGLRLASESEWVLFLDADERLTEASRLEIEHTLSTAPPEIAGFWFPRKNVAFGRILRGGGWWPDHQARVIRSGYGRYDETREVHEVVEFDGPTARLEQPVVHLNYNSRLEFMRKQRLYTLRSVSHAQGCIPRRRSYIGRPMRQFWRRLVSLHGYRDGMDGVFMALVMALEEIRACRLLRQGNRS